jgi:lipoprotein-anchoring transpeptidase ErfK/SrfK
MRQRSFIALTAAVAFLLIGSVAVYAYDSSHSDQIASGIRAGGVNIGGLKTSAARAKLRRDLTASMNRPVVAVYHGKRFRLDPATTGLRVDVDGMIDEALQRSRDGNLFSRTVRGVFGGKVNVDVAVRSTYSHKAVARLVKRIERRLDRPAQDASIDFLGGSLQHVKERKGRAVKGEALRQDVERSLAQPGGVRVVPIETASIKPKVTTHELAAKYPTVIAINRSAFQLTLFKHLQRVKSYTIAVGRQGLETPAGEYTVEDKQINPSWHVPNSSWAGSLAGQVIPPGPQDPLKARWIGIVGGAGIHGTEDIGSLGSNASHGCIRMAIPDVIELFDRTPYGSKIFIH